MCDIFLFLVSPLIILKRHTPQLLEAIGDSNNLAVSMWANDLLTNHFNNKLQTTQELSQFQKAQMILTEVYLVVDMLVSSLLASGIYIVILHVRLLLYSCRFKNIFCCHYRHLHECL